MIVNHLLKRGKLVLGSILLTACMHQQVMAEAGTSLQWTKVLGPSASSASSMQSVADGGYILAGQVKEAGGQTGLLLVKADANGRQEWSRTLHYNGYGKSSGKAARQTQDGGYIAVGTTFSTDHGKPNDDVLLVKTDAQGVTLWEQRFGGGQAEWGEDVAELPDGGYLIAGTYVSGAIPTRVGILIRTDREGHKLWSRNCGDLTHSSNISLHTLLPLGDGTFVAGGQQGTSFLSDDGKAYIVRVNDQGETVWEHRLMNDRGGKAELFDIQSTGNGGFIATGQLNNGGANGHDLYLLKLDKDGMKQWETLLGGTGFDAGNAVQPADDGGYVVSGTLGGQAGGNSDLWIVKTDGSGKLQWQQTVGGSGSERGSGIVQTGKGAFLAAGDTTLAEDIPSAGGGASGAQGSRVLLAKVKEHAPDESGEELAAIEFQYSSYSLSSGESGPTVLKAVYQNEEKQPLTGAVRYYSNDSRIASIDGQGVLTGVSQGTTFLTAEYEGLTTNATVTVRDPKAPELIGLTAEPERLDLSVGTIGQIRLQALYKDGSAKDVTALARWYVNDKKTAVAEQGGAIRAVSPGTTFATAEYDGLSAVIDITVK